MKFTCEVDRSLRETVRINTEWHAAFRLSRYSHFIRDVRIVVRSPPGNATLARFECLVWIRLDSGDPVIIQEKSEHVSDALTLAIDRAASSVARYSRPPTRVANPSHEFN
jgi:D-aminopeptidase